MDYLSIEGRKNCLSEILGQENKLRKTESFKRLEIYKNKQKQYIYRELLDTVSQETFKQMRKMASINLSRKVINSMASIYKDEPERVYEGATDRELEAIAKLYELMMINVKMKKANRYYKLHEQVTLQVLPKKGSLHVRVLSPHHFDVIPDPEMPEGEPLAYILSGFDADVEKMRNASAMRSGNTGYDTYAGYIDSVNQKIGDKDDYKSKLNYFVWWTKEHHFVTDRDGNFLFDNGSVGLDLNLDDYKNPVAPHLPFVDVVVDRDFEYWLDSGSNVTDFQVDLGVQLSDMADISWRQGYSQAVISATEMPNQIATGPHTVLFLKQDPNRTENQPQFQFASPTPDLSSSLELIKAEINMWLSSLSEDTNLVSTAEGGGKTFSSGVERLLALIEKFEASRDDMDLFKYVEKKLFKLIVAWNNVLQTAENVDPELKNGNISEDITLSINFKKPEMMQTQSEKEELIAARLERGLMSMKKAIMETYGVSEEEAEKIILEIKEEQLSLMKESQGQSEEVESSEELEGDGIRQVDEADPSRE